MSMVNQERNGGAHFKESHRIEPNRKSEGANEGLFVQIEGGKSHKTAVGGRRGERASDYPGSLGSTQ